MDLSAVNYGFQCYPEHLKDVLKQMKSLEHRDVSIAWRNVRFEVREFAGLAGKKKVLLNRLNGYFETGTLGGLLGPSGAGKTTLLNCLSGGNRSGLTADSEIYLNTKECKSTVSYFIAQHVHENIIGQLTVGQILRYAFRFKNGAAETEGQLRTHIVAIMAALLLPPELESRRFARCSGGEQKRIAIAQELMSLNAPTFLFIDEPTSGLDSQSAFEVMLCLQKLARSQHITVVASIHAPNDDTLNLFDKLYVLAKGGVCIYSGPPSQIKPLLLKHQFPLLPEQPPIEALIKIACHGINDSSVQTLSQACLASSHSEATSHLHALTHLPFGLPNPRKRFSTANFLLQFRRLFSLTFLTHYRIFLLQLFLTILYYIIMATMFNPTMTRPTSCLPLDPTTVNSTALGSSTCSTSDIYDNSLIMENICFLSYSFMFIGYLVICSSTQFFLPLLKSFQSEHRNYWYSTGVFFWSSLCLSLVQVSCLSIVMSVASYFLTRQHLADNGELNWYRMANYTFLIWLLCFYMESVGKFIGVALMKYTKLAIVFCQILYSFMCMHNGFYIELDDTASDLVLRTADLISLRFITKNMLWTIYGIDRCRANEFSWIMLNNSVDGDQFHQNWIRVVINIAVVQIATLILMLLKFNNFDDHPVVKLAKKCKEKQESLELNQAIPIDWGNPTPLDVNGNDEAIAIDYGKSNNLDACSNSSSGKVIIGWKNLTLYGSSTIYEIGSTKVMRKPILRNLNGQFRFGTLNGLMGTSGSGKTSCLKVLNGQCKTRLGEETEIYLSKFSTIRTCFINQEVSGHLLPGLTAKQMLIYASKLKNVNHDIDHEQVAMQWLQELDLLEIANTRSELCSGGERKRLAVSLELTAVEMPNLVCIDEPTSGLDSNSAETVIATLRKLTRKHPMTIITSIHQPNAEILCQLDQLYVLARGGVAIYCGSPQKIQSHLKAIPQLETATSQYPIETLIKHSCSNFDNDIVQALSNLTNHQFSGLERQLASDTHLVPDGITLNRNRFSLYSIYVLSQRYLAFIKGHLWFSQLFYFVNFLLFSFFLNRIFDPDIATPSGCVNLEDNLNVTCFSSGSTEKVFELKQLTNNYRYSFYMTSICMFNLILNSALLFAQEFEFLKREHRNGWYSAGSFYIVKCAFEILPTIPLMFIHVYVCNIYSTVRPGIYWPLTALFILTAVALQGFAHIFALLSNGNLLILTSLTVLTYVSLTMISNFFLSIANLHYIYNFASNFSIPRFIFECLMLLQYGSRCSPKEIQSVLLIMGINESDFYFKIAMLFFNLVLYRAITVYLVIYKLNPVENRRARVARISENLSQLKAHKKLQLLGLDSNNEFHISLPK